MFIFFPTLVDEHVGLCVVIVVVATMASMCSLVLCSFVVVVLLLYPRVAVGWVRWVKI